MYTNLYIVFFPIYTSYFSQFIHRYFPKFIYKGMYTNLYIVFSPIYTSYFSQFIHRIFPQKFIHRIFFNFIHECMYTNLYIVFFPICTSHFPQRSWRMNVVFYEVATISKLSKNIGLFCKRAL